MKKFLSLFMAMVVTLSIMAAIPTEFGQKVDPTGHATKLMEKKLQHHQDVTKVLQLNKLERKAISKTNAEEKQLPAELAKAPQVQNEVITLNYDGLLECNAMKRMANGGLA